MEHEEEGGEPGAIEDAGEEVEDDNEDEYSESLDEEEDGSDDYYDEEIEDDEDEEEIEIFIGRDPGNLDRLSLQDLRNRAGFGNMQRRDDVMSMNNMSVDLFNLPHNSQPESIPEEPFDD